jgi:ubiquinone/menaquinone biosynthesis C-methylase UbiE
LSIILYAITAKPPARAAKDPVAPMTWRTVGRMNEATRVAWIESALKQVPAGSRLLDAGAGEQQFRQFCSHLDYVSQDFAQYVPGADPSGLHTEKWEYGSLDIVSDITAIPEPDGSFVAVLCTEVLDHIPNPIEALREFARLARPGGQLIVTAPFCSITHQSPYHFATGFSRYFYAKHLPNFGFDINEITPNGNYFEYVAQDVWRTRDIGRKYAGKRTSLVDLGAMWVAAHARHARAFQSCRSRIRRARRLRYHLRTTKK